MEREADVTLQLTVERARKRADETGELRPALRSGFTRRPVSAELAEFVHRVLTDGTFAEAVRQIGIEDPDMAST
jgi:hypothetical protein